MLCSDAPVRSVNVDPFTLCHGNHYARPTTTENVLCDWICSRMIRLYIHEQFVSMFMNTCLDVHGCRKVHSDNFAPFVGTEEDFALYVRDMATPRTWGDELTLRAAVDVFNVKVHVITTEAENYLLHYDPDNDSRADAAKRHLFLSYVSPIHYNTVAPLP